MQLVYIGNPREPHESKAEVVAYGITFRMNEPVEVTDELAIRKLSNNYHFIVVEEADSSLSLEAEQEEEVERVLDEAEEDLDASRIPATEQEGQAPRRVRKTKA